LDAQPAQFEKLVSRICLPERGFSLMTQIIPNPENIWGDYHPKAVQSIKTAPLLSIRYI
jgi:hypothetical protein